MYYAHSRNVDGIRHDLYDHLTSVSRLASEYAETFGAMDAAHWLGMWHDIGKIHPDFQHYLLQSEAGKRLRSPGHSGAGTLHTAEHLNALAMIVQGHHGGLKSPQDLKSWLASGRGLAYAQEGMETALEAWPQLSPPSEIPLPDAALSDALSAELLIRFLLSCLVDADYGDTEAHFAGEYGCAEHPSLSELWQRFEADQTRLSGQRSTPVNAIRHSIYLECLRAAQGTPGLYRLTVPTGGGKTRSGMAFALRHAILHDMERIIVAIPFISITEQTAAIYRGIFGEQAIIEHHSGVSGDSNDEERWDRMVAENWDAPIIVTTTVQLFESLFSNRPRSVRKLHRLAKSVIIIDEVQSLPTHLLRPILDTLSLLADQYSATVVLSTATQPAFEAIPDIRELDAREIIADPAPYYSALKRTSYEWRLDESLSWQEAADLALQETQSLSVLNTKRNAMDLFAEVAVSDPTAIHLSSAMCGRHRQRVIDLVHRRLNDGSPCHLVSTQVVEAGVDIDFPLVLRAMGPLDSIIQAAGRCNRNGRLETGRVVVFEPTDSGTPPGYYATATNLARVVLGSGHLDPNSYGAVNYYYDLLYKTLDVDRNEVRRCQEALDYVETARRFKMIEDETQSAVVIYGTDNEQQETHDLVTRLERGWGNPRQLLRQLQPSLVSVRRWNAERALSQGLANEIIPGLLLWLGDYDEQCGLIERDMNESSLVI